MQANHKQMGEERGIFLYERSEMFHTLCLCHNLAYISQINLHTYSNCYVC